MKRLVLAAVLVAAASYAGAASAEPPCTPQNTIADCVRDLIGPIGG